MRIQMFESFVLKFLDMTIGMNRDSLEGFRFGEAFDEYLLRRRIDRIGEWGSG